MTLSLLPQTPTLEPRPGPTLRPSVERPYRIRTLDLTRFRERVLDALRTPASASTPATRYFDSVLCFGDSDWWYHNRGHADMQFIRRFSRRCPVLYVNSLGMGTPSLSEGRMFYRRVIRKARSVARYYRDGGEGFPVLSPLFFPVYEGRKGEWMARALALQLQGVMRAAGMRRPLLWVACPSAACVLDRIDNAGVAHQLSDCYAALNTERAAAALDMEAAVATRADVVVCSSRRLQEHAVRRYGKGEYVDHGVDYDHFAAAADAGDTPRELAGLKAPIVGFFGNVDGNTVDLALLKDVIRARPQYHFVFVGPMASDYECLRDFPNVTAVPKQPYHAVARYGAAFDVCLMPWRQCEWIEHCNPVKLKEYLSLGKPVVSTPFPELLGYAEFCYQARTPAEFAAAIDRAWREDSPDRRQARQRFVARHTWDAKFEQVIELLEERGIELGSSASPACEAEGERGRGGEGERGRQRHYSNAVERVVANPQSAIRNPPFSPSPPRPLSPSPHRRCHTRMSTY